MEKTRTNKLLKVLVIVINVLIAIIIGIISFNQSIVDCTFEFGGTPDQEIQSFNAQFTSYVGSGRTASEIKWLVDKVNVSNAYTIYLVTINNNKSDRYKFIDNTKPKRYTVDIEKNGEVISNINIYENVNGTVNETEVVSKSIEAIERNNEFIQKKEVDIKSRDGLQERIEQSKKININYNMFIRLFAIYIILVILPYLIIYIALKIKKHHNRKKYKDEELINKNNKTEKLGIILYIVFLIIALLIWVIIILNTGRVVQVMKPIIYIYPTEETTVAVELDNKEALTCTYPLYKDKWEVIAKTDGTLIDKKTGKSYYALYWEGKSNKNYFEKLKEGFIIKGEDTASFLEEKLEILGLNEREAEEFIVFWLPRMQNNKYNYIRFQTIDEIKEIMNLKITPEPETIIRVMMEWKALDKPINVKEQELTKIERHGYTVVEWGGTEIN